MENLELSLAKLLGEVYRVQKEQGIYRGTDARIYGLLNGIEEAVKGELDDLEYVSNAEIDWVCDVFEPFANGEQDMASMPSLKTIQLKLERKGITEGKLPKILDYLYLSDRYNAQIEQIKSWTKNVKDKI